MKALTIACRVVDSTLAYRMRVGPMPFLRGDGSLPAFNYRGITLAAVGGGVIVAGWLFRLGEPAADYVSFGGWALAAVGTVLHFRDNNVAGDERE